MELARINRVISKHENELDKLHAASETITEQKQFIESIENSELHGENGLCRINLKWNTIDDLDLHLTMPDGTIDSNKDAYYSNMKVEYNGGVCTLDHDAIPDHDGENPQENIIWKDKLPDGQHALRVKLYGKKGNKSVIPFSVTFFAGKYVKTELYEFNNVGSGSVIDIATLTFKKGKVVTPIKFK
ncbi:MAG: hypothetical protein IKW78_05010 [Prevotella sp.]|nr:hypothetical protein [Prevotella sp.]